MAGRSTVRRHESAPLSGNVIFPITRAQRNGLEDLRLVQFTEDDGTQYYCGTYTAYLRSRDRLRDADDRAFRGIPARRRCAARRPQHKGLAALPAPDRRPLRRDRPPGPRGALLPAERRPLHLELRQADHGAEISVGAGAARQLRLADRDQTKAGSCSRTASARCGSIRWASALLDKNDPSKVLGRSAEPFLTPDRRDARRLCAQRRLYLRRPQGRRDAAAAVRRRGFRCPFHFRQDRRSALNAEIGARRVLPPGTTASGVRSTGRGVEPMPRVRVPTGCSAIQVSQKGCGNPQAQRALNLS